MLTLIGLGLYDEKDLTLRGIEEAKKADAAFIELYTSYWHGNLKNLEKIINRKITKLDRKDLEENSDKILLEAKAKNVVIFVQGDPLIATTHTSLLAEANRLGIGISIVHNASIYSAIAETGLHIYKFGQTVTIPFPDKTKGILPKSVYDAIKTNKENGLHTLVLLDIDTAGNRYMLPQEAVGILLGMESKFRQHALPDNTETLIIGRLGGSCTKEFKPLKDILSSHFRDLPAVMVIPGKLHYTERDFLEVYSRE